MSTKPFIKLINPARLNVGDTLAFKYSPDPGLVRSYFRTKFGPLERCRRKDELQKALLPRLATMEVTAVDSFGSTWVIYGAKLPRDPMLKNRGVMLCFERGQLAWKVLFWRSKED